MLSRTLSQSICLLLFPHRWIHLQCLNQSETESHEAEWTRSEHGGLVIGNNDSDLEDPIYPPASSETNTRSSPYSKLFLHILRTWFTASQKCHMLYSRRKWILFLMRIQVYPVPTREEREQHEWGIGTEPILVLFKLLKGKNSPCGQPNRKYLPGVVYSILWWQMQ